MRCCMLTWTRAARAFSVAISALAGCLTVAGCVAEQAPERRTDTSAVLPTITVTGVNRGTYGMAAQVRWAFSPDRRAVLVTVDPAGVEAEPVPNAFFFGVEEPAFAVQVDTVWDVVPSPDWRAVAYSRAYVLSAGEAELVPEAMWQDLARRTGIDVATLRAAAFDASAMAYMKGIAQPALIRVPPDPRAADAAQTGRARTFAIPRGWRVRWTADGSTIALGSNPEMAQDESPSRSWSALDPRTGAVSVSLPSGAELVEPQWVTGPLLTYGVDVNISSAPSIAVRHGELNYVIESQRGVISIRDPAFQTRAVIPVGAGVALAATASGRYVVALRPRSNAREYETPVEVVVYTVTL